MLRHPLFYLSLSIFILACAKSNEGTRCSLGGSQACEGGGTVVVQGGPATLDGAIACTAQSTKSVYAHNETVGVTIAASGGSGVYAVPGFITSFAGSTTIYIGTYKNYGSSDRAVEKAVSITDSDGRITSCNFRFTVTPSSPTGSNALACGITPSKNNPMVGESINFAIKATGGTAGYSFGLFYPRQGESPKALASVSGGDASVSHTYSWVGYADPAVMVKDAAGSSVWCEIPNRYMNILPRTTPKVFASVSAATVDADGNATDSKDLFRVTLSTSGFAGTDQIDFSYTNLSDGVFSENGVSVAQNQGWTGDNTFFIKRLDGLSHDFNIKFKAATADGQVATIPVNIKFGDYLACYVSEPAYLFQGVEGSFKVDSYSGEAVEIAEVVNPSGVAIRKFTSGNSGVLGLTFAAQGFYEIRFKAKSRTDALKYCNGKSDYVVGAWILPAPSTLTGCEVRPSVNTVSKDSPVRIDIIRKGGSVDINGYYTTLVPNGSNTLEAGPYVNGPDTVSVNLKLSEIKTYLLSASMRENSTGKTVYCQSYIQVVTQPGLLAKIYDVPWGKNDGLARRTSWVYRGGDQVVQTVNVSPRRSDCNDRKYSHLQKYGFSNDCQYPGVHTRKEWFGVEYEGYIKAPVAGNYNFRFDVDDGISLEIDGVSVIWFDGLHSPQTTPIVSRYLSAGDHTIRIRYFQGPKWEVANVFFWQKPGGIWEIVPAGSFRQP